MVVFSCESPLVSHFRFVNSIDAKANDPLVISVSDGESFVDVGSEFNVVNEENAILLYYNHK